MCRKLIQKIFIAVLFLFLFMYEVIEEGRARIKVKKAAKISKKMEVFYNPVMKHNRDISILLLNCIDKKSMRVALPLAGTGVRGIRFLLEVGKGKIEHISFNDCSKDALKSIKANISLSIGRKLSNSLAKKIRLHNEDANLFILNSSGFDCIDIDPFGSPNPFLDAAVKRLARDGILAVTATDTAALTGTSPKACRRKYWAEPLRDEVMHETGLRILIRKVQLIGAQYEKALIPIFSYFKDHYFRVFFICRKGKKEVDGVMKQHGLFNGAGPLWGGRLWDSALANKMHSLSKSMNDNALIKFLNTIKGESKIDSVGFYDIPQLVKKSKIGKIPKKDELIKKIKKQGYRAAATHFTLQGIRSDIGPEKLVTLLRSFKVRSKIAW
jgi:tRNA (guanine26-N2/guanine27-N2)-dimethyltransferase